jgi:hypothetical protein
MTVTRRAFLQSSAATAAVTLASGTLINTVAKTQADMTPGPGNKWPGRVAINFNKNVTSVDSTGNPTVDTAIVAKMVDDTIMLLTGESTVGAAWKAVFPSTLSATSTIVLKVPVAFATKRMAPHWSVSKAIVDGLTQMDFGGTKYPAGNITLFDMEGSDKLSSYGYTAESIPGITIIFYKPSDARASGSTDGAVSADGTKKYDYAKPLQSDFLINIFRPGGHFTSFEGFTLAFKNHFGTYKPNHESKCLQYLRDINCSGVVYKKTVLCVCAGLFGAKEASADPGSIDINYSTYVKKMDSVATVINPSTIFMSTDPVTSEMQAIKLMRLNNGKAYDVASLPSYLKSSGGVAGGLSDKVYNIGVIDEEKMDIMKIINGEKVAVGIGNKNHSTAGNHTDIKVKTLKNHASTFIEYSIPHSSIGSEASIEVFNLKGNKVFSTKQPINGIVNNYSWDEKNSNGQRVPNGKYIVSLHVNTVKLSQQITLIR